MLYDYDYYSNLTCTQNQNHTQHSLDVYISLRLGSSTSTYTVDDDTRDSNIESHFSGCLVAHTACDTDRAEASSVEGVRGGRNVSH